MEGQAHPREYDEPTGLTGEEERLAQGVPLVEEHR
jgi:hypothetical protein